MLPPDFPLLDALARSETPETLTETLTERVRADRAEQRLREMQSMLNMAAQMGRLGAWTFVVGEAFVTWSEEVCVIHKVPPGTRPTPEEAIAFFAPEYQDSLSAVMSKSLFDGSPFDIEGEIVTGSGERVWVRTIGEAEWDEQGRVCKLKGAMQDISQARHAAERELRMAEQLAVELAKRVTERTVQLETANQELEAFSYSIAHDLRGPLSSIDGFSIMLQRSAGDNLPERSQHYLSRIRAGVRRMSELTDALLTLSTLARTSLVMGPVDLAAMARAAVSACREGSGNRQVAVSVAPSMPGYGDERLLMQAMSHLVGNAWKFSSRTPDAQIEVGVKPEANGEPVYFVRDNGTGFDMEYASKMFEPFHRLHAFSDFEGTGMGLAIVRKVVTRHGGRVWAGSAPGEGASFFFTLGRPGTLHS